MRLRQIAVVITIALAVAAAPAPAFAGIPVVRRVMPFRHEPDVKLDANCVVKPKPQCGTGNTFWDAVWLVGAGFIIVATISTIRR
jgi:hypothetical protein